MKFEHDSKMIKVAVYSFLVLAAAIVFNMLLQHIGTMFGWVQMVLGFLKSVVIGFCIAFLLNPLLRTIEKKLMLRLFPKLKPTARRGLSILLTYLVALIFVSLFVALVVPQVIVSLKGIGANVPSYMKYLENLYLQISTNLSDMELFDSASATEMLATLFDSIKNAFENLLGRVGDWLTGDFVGRVWDTATSITSGVVDIILGVIISIYFLNDKEKLFAQCKKLTTALLRPSTSNLISDILMDMNKVFNGFIIGKLIDSFIIGILCFIGMSILRLPYTVLISVIVGVTNIIPYFGPFIGAIPGFLLVFISDPAKGPMQSLLFLIFILVLQQFDGNILGPKILGDSTGLSAFWVIFAIMLFSGLLGIVGMFIGVPLFAVLYNLTRRLVAHILRKKGKSTDTRDYASEENPLIR